MKPSDILPFFSEDDASFAKDPRDLVHAHGDMVSALLYSTIFFPEFVEVDGSILHGKNDLGRQERFRSGLTEEGWTRPALEASFNTIEVSYLFSNVRTTLHNDDESDVIEQKLAKLIADSWRYRLKDLYPERVFSVSILTPEESGSVYSVEFFEIR